MITRKFDTYTFVRDDGKSCSVTLTNGEIKIVGFTGRPVKNVPKGAPMILADVASPLMTPEMREVIDRVVSLGKATYFSPRSEDCAWLLANWKLVVSVIRKEGFSEIHNWTTQIRKVAFMNELLKFIPAEYLDQNFAQYTCHPDYFKYKLFVHEIKALTTKYIKAQKAIEAMKAIDGAKEAIEQFGCKIGLRPIGSFIHNKCEIMGGIVVCCKELGVEVPKENLGKDFRHTYDILEERVRNMVEEKCSKAFGEFQSRHNLEFEHNGYSIYVPKTYGECVKVGDHFRNCFGNYEWQTYLKTRCRNGVVVCKNGEWVVCADINACSGKIIQYLLPCNRKVESLELFAFKEAYQDYLNGIWNN